MPSCKICKNDLRPFKEETSVIGVPIKSWECPKCGFRRWAHEKKEFDEWDKLYGEEVRKSKDTSDRKCVFYSLLDNDDVGTEEKDCDKECSCKSGNKPPNCGGCGN